MRQVIIVSLDNTAYHVDEDAYSALRKYLDRARNGLRDNPDVEEIMGDLERSIAEKCRTSLTDGKNVVSFESMSQILGEMGPVEEPAADQEPHSKPAPEAGQRRRLYKRREGAVLDGVCMGLSEYFHIDVVIFRVLFVVLAFASGFGLLAYLVLMLAMPGDITPAPRRAFPSEGFKKALVLIGAVSMIILGWLYITVSIPMGRPPFSPGFPLHSLRIALPYVFLVLLIGCGIWLVRRSTTR
jgi:phage shock protein PspC (stress-responsive transcriptional regulator)